MADPPRLPPPPFWRTQYFALTVMAKADRRWIDPLDVEFALSRPVREKAKRMAAFGIGLTSHVSAHIFGWYARRRLYCPQRIQGQRLLRMSADLDYDPATASLYIKLGPGGPVA